MSRRAGPTVLLIAGYLRIGSTVLERMLARVDGFVAVGELRYLWQHGIRDDHRCGCGDPFSACPFWNEVLARAFGGRNQVPLSRLLELQRRIDRQWNIPLLSRPARTPDGGFAGDAREYVAAFDRVIDAVAEVSGARVIVDSSKAASHGFVLATNPSRDLRVVHLLRDSRAVAHSWTRTKAKPEVATRVEWMPRYPVARSALEWDLLNVAADALARGRVHDRMRYEDLVADPARVLARTLTALGLGEPDVSFVAGGSFEAGVDHTVSGNPMRFERGRVTVTADRAWERDLRAGPRALVTALTWPLLAAYGYAKPGARPPR